MDIFFLLILCKRVKSLSKELDRTRSKHRITSLSVFTLTYREVIILTVAIHCWSKTRFRRIYPFQCKGQKWWITIAPQAAFFFFFQFFGWQDTPFTAKKDAYFEKKRERRKAFFILQEHNVTQLNPPIKSFLQTWLLCVGQDYRARQTRSQAPMLLRLGLSSINSSLILVVGWFWIHHILRS